MLKTVLKLKHGVCIDTYPKLMAFVRTCAKGHKPKKSKVFSVSEIQKFLVEAPDSKYLGMKAVLIVGLSGACRGNEMIKLTLNNFEKHSPKLMLVKLFKTKTEVDRSFVIHEDCMDILEKYMASRPRFAKTNRFFLRYVNGKCSDQPIGRNQMGLIPQKIANYLKLKDSHLYTGHCLRRTSTLLMYSSRADPLVSDVCSKVHVARDWSLPSTSKECISDENRPVSGTSSPILECFTIETSILPDA